MIQVATTPYGADAHRALAAEIARLKGGDPLRPMSVVVSSNPIGIAARRALGHAGGIAAVTFLTPYRLAELLGAAAVAATGRRPLSTPVLAGAVRAVLADEPGHFGGVASHPATERSLVRAHRTLSEVGPTGLERLAATSPRTADVVRVHRAVSERLRPKFSDEQGTIELAFGSTDTFYGGLEVCPRESSQTLNHTSLKIIPMTPLSCRRLLVLLCSSKVNSTRP